jgi:hypothetical protein
MRRTRLLMALLVALGVAAVDTTVAEEGTAATKRCDLRLASPASAGPGWIEVTVESPRARRCSVGGFPIVEALGRDRRVLPLESGPGGFAIGKAVAEVSRGHAARTRLVLLDRPTAGPRARGRCWEVAYVRLELGAPNSRALGSLGTLTTRLAQPTRACSAGAEPDISYTPLRPVSA